MQRAVNLTIAEVDIALQADTDAEEQLLRHSGKMLAKAISDYKVRFPGLPAQELLARVALEMTVNALEAESELDKIKDECKDLLNF